MADETFTFTCAHGHTFESGNRIRAFCPECGTSTRRAATPPTAGAPAPDRSADPSPRRTKVTKIVSPPTHKEPPVPSTKKPAAPARKPAPPARKPAPKTPPPPLNQAKAPRRAQPLVAKKHVTTTKQRLEKAAEAETMFTRMRRLAFGR